MIDASRDHFRNMMHDVLYDDRILELNTVLYSMGKVGICKMV